MRIRLLSDLHLEFGPFRPPPVPCDVVVLAGDVATGTAGVRWAATTFSGTPVVYVPGNHEFYGHEVTSLLSELRDTGARLGVHVLSDSAVTLHGVRFLGATLWTDFALHGSPQASALAAGQGMNDYVRIRIGPGKRHLRPEDTAAFHLESRRWLGSELGSSDEPTVVVTHTAPSRRCVAPAFARDVLSPAFASNLDELVLTGRPHLWVHGHTHHASDLAIGPTRVLSNQRGYPSERTPGFVPGLVVEVEGGAPCEP